MNTLLPTRTLRIPPQSRTNRHNITMNSSSGYENNSTINIINFFDKLHENNLYH